MKTKRMRYSRKRVFLGLFLFLVLLGLGIGYAFVTTKLSIEGVANVKDAKWDIHFTNYELMDGSIAPISQPRVYDTSVSFSAKLNNPGDFYGFTIDVVNNGTINAALDSISITPSFNDVTYIDSSITYDDNTPIQTNDLLKSGVVKKIKVYYEYKDELDDDEYPVTDQSYDVTIQLNYIQYVNKNLSSFDNDSWATIVTNVIDNPKTYDIGESKSIELDINNDGQIGNGEEFRVRVANNSTPEECSQAGFSQTACGFVVSFEKPILNSKMFNSVGTTGGYPASIVYNTYIKNNSSSWIYNMFPTALQNGIIDTYVVSGYENGNSANYETTDKIYLLSPHEIMVDADGDANSGLNVNDKAYNNTRQLDYYDLLGVTTASYGNARDNQIWLRSSNYENTNKNFWYLNSTGYISTVSSTYNIGVLPVFRIGSNS